MHSPIRTKRNRWSGISEVDRFGEKCEPVPFSGCLIWTAASVPFGYGVFFYEGRQQYAHRVAWQIENGAIPDGLHVLHRCDTPACVSVRHLFLGTLRDNAQDMVKKGRSRGGPPSGDRNPMRMYRGLLSGERNGNAKFNRTQIDEIRSAHERGETQVSIAARYGVRQSDISRIVRFEAWK